MYSGRPTLERVERVDKLDLEDWLMWILEAKTRKLGYPEDEGRRRTRGYVQIR